MARRSDQPGTGQAALDEEWQSPPSRDAGSVLRVLALVAVALGLTALTAAACALSYQSIHVLAGQAGVSDQLARIYPLIFDALLVVSGCSVLALRGAGLPSKIYAWFCLIVLLAALAAGAVVHAAGYHVPLRPAEITAAIVPFALVLLGFGLLLALLRHARLRRARQRTNRPVAVPDRLALTSAPASVPQDAAPAQSSQTDQEAISVPAPAPAAPVPADVSPADVSPADSGAATVRLAKQAAAPATRVSQAAPTVPLPAVSAKQDRPANQDAPARPAVRQAELQLRARIPRPAPDSDDLTGPTPAGSADTAPSATTPAEPSAQPAPLMPPVSPHAAGPVTDQPRRTSLRRFRSKRSAPADRAASADVSGGEAVESSAYPDTDDLTTRAELSAAPTELSADASADPELAADEGAPPPPEPPALERPRSSPTRPHD